MEINWILLGVVFIAAILLVIYLIKRNLRDEKDVTQYFDKEYNSGLGKQSEVDEEDTH